MTSRPHRPAPEDRPDRAAEPFLARWSRRKEEARQEAVEPVPQEAADSETAAPELPPPEKLTLESDYRGFFHPKVSEDLRRAALKKLFSDPHFNVMDGLDVYIDDYSKSEPIPAAMLASLKQAQRILEWAKEDELERAREDAARDAPVAALERPSTEAQPGTEVTPHPGDAVPAAPGTAGSRP